MKFQICFTNGTTLHRTLKSEAEARELAAKHAKKNHTHINCIFIVP